MFVAFLDSFIICGVGSHLKQFGSSPAIFRVMIEDNVPSRDKLFRVEVLFKPTIENTLSASALECGSTKTKAAIFDSLPNWFKPVTLKKGTRAGPLFLKCFPFIIITNEQVMLCAKYFLPCSLLWTFFPKTPQHQRLLGPGARQCP